mmetsp:Transcript_13382/g.18137  ORF Transcript_13382/g.18137 Transcript_13382/m.18137 type:complete len:93 (+) Transcript_13382:951-1229(+)
MIISCCMWWKRKETDIFPEFGAEKLQSLRYSSVKYQFEVMPRRNRMRVTKKCRNATSLLPSVSVLHSKYGSQVGSLSGPDLGVYKSTRDIQS